MHLYHCKETELRIRGCDSDTTYVTLRETLLLTSVFPYVSGGVGVDDFEGRGLWMGPVLAPVLLLPSTLGVMSGKANEAGALALGKAKPHPHAQCAQELPSQSGVGGS